MPIIWLHVLEWCSNSKTPKKTPIEWLLCGIMPLLSNPLGLSRGKLPVYMQIAASVLFLVAGWLGRLFDDDLILERRNPCRSRCKTGCKVKNLQRFRVKFTRRASITEDYVSVTGSPFQISNWEEFAVRHGGSPCPCGLMWTTIVWNSCWRLELSLEWQ